MTAINSSTLFHFTGRLNTLKRIVTEGIRFSYSFEYSPTEGNDLSLENGIAIPMICFCDIPLMRINEHRNKYGDYAVGVDKEFISDVYNSIINPVWYTESQNVSDLVVHFSKWKNETTNSESDLAVKFAKKMVTDVKNGQTDFTRSVGKYKEQLEKVCDRKFFVNHLIGLSKPFGYINNRNKYICNYDEENGVLSYPIKLMGEQTGHGMLIEAFLKIGERNGIEKSKPVRMDS